MITAAEARNLTDSAASEVRKLLDQIEHEIREVANRGQSIYNTTIEGSYFVTDSYRHVENSTLDLLLHELQEFGFKCQIVRERLPHTGVGNTKDRSFIQIKW